MIIETPRLILRDWRESDVEPWIAMNADAKVMEFYESTCTRERSVEMAATMRARLAADGYGWMVVEIKEGAPFAGVVALQAVPFEAHFTPAMEIGWRFAYGIWGNGYASEAAAALLGFAFANLGVSEVVAMTAQINARSRRVMERIGMTYDPADDFDNPRVSPGHRLQPHVLYRARK